MCVRVSIVHIMFLCCAFIVRVSFVCRMSAICVTLIGRKITNLRFADDIDGITGEEDELTELVHNLDTVAEKFGMEISAEKTEIMTNNGTLQRDITI